MEKGIEAVLGGRTGTTVSYGLKEGGISLTGLEDGVDSSKCVIADHRDVLKQVRRCATRSSPGADGR